MRKTIKKLKEIQKLIQKNEDVILGFIEFQQKLAAKIECIGEEETLGSSDTRLSCGCREEDLAGILDVKIAFEEYEYCNKNGDRYRYTNRKIKSLIPQLKIISEELETQLLSFLNIHTDLPVPSRQGLEENLSRGIITLSPIITNDCYLELKILEDLANEIRRLQSESKFDYYDENYRKLRLKVFLRDGEICAKCGARPSPGLSLTIDHIKPVSKFPELTFDMDNLQVLCWECNQTKSDKY